MKRRISNRIIKRSPEFSNNSRRDYQTNEQSLEVAQSEIPQFLTLSLDVRNAILAEASDRARKIYDAELALQFKAIQSDINATIDEKIERSAKKVSDSMTAQGSVISEIVSIKTFKSYETDIERKSENAARKILEEIGDKHLRRFTVSGLFAVIAASIGLVSSLYYISNSIKNEMKNSIETEVSNKSSKITEQYQAVFDSIAKVATDNMQKIMGERRRVEDIVKIADSTDAKIREAQDKANASLKELDLMRGTFEEMKVIDPEKITAILNLAKNGVFTDAVKLQSTVNSLELRVGKVESVKWSVNEEPSGGSVSALVSCKRGIAITGSCDQPVEDGDVSSTYLINFGITKPDTWVCTWNRKIKSGQARVLCAENLTIYKTQVK